MTAVALLLGVLLAQGHGARAGGGGKRKAPTAATAPRGGDVQKRAPSPAASGAENGGGGGGDDGAKMASKAASEVAGGSGPGKNFKSKTYNFGAMDVEGKLKTPQLLYFLNRVKLELDMSAPDTRSFMKELERSADDKNL